MKIDLDELDRWIAAYREAEESDRPMSATLPFIEQMKEKWGSSRDVLETLSSEVRKLRENAKTDLGRRIAISRRLKSPVAGEMGKVTEVLPDGFGKYVWIVELNERSSDLNTQVTEAVLRAESSNDLSDWVNLYKLEVELSKVADSDAEKQIAERGATNTKNKILALLGFDVEAARERMLKVAEAVDEGQSFMECVEIVELECDSEWEHRVQLEEEVKRLRGPYGSMIEAADREANPFRVQDLTQRLERLEVENRETRELCEQADQLNERARKQVEELTAQVTKLAVDNARYRVACCDLERKVDLSLLPYEAREAVRQCIFATWTDEERARPPEKCPDCHDGGACLPGGCGVEGCERCGKPCPTCGGSCEVKTGRKT